jgi:hypothetical protein
MHDVHDEGRDVRCHSLGRKTTEVAEEAHSPGKGGLSACNARKEKPGCPDKATETAHVPPYMPSWYKLLAWMAPYPRWRLRNPPIPDTVQVQP